MSKRKFLIFTCLLAVLLSVYYYFHLPERVAVHFRSGGEADGYSSREIYLCFSVGLYIIMTGLFLGLPYLIRKMPLNLVNIPHRDYWLAPERKGKTIKLIANLTHRFGAALNLFLIFIAYLTYKANLMAEVKLDMKYFLTGLGLFFAYTIYWIVDLYRKFRIRGTVA